MKAVKRSIGKINVLSPRSRVLVPITFSAPHYSAALSIILSKLEEKFSTQVIILKPNNIIVDDIPEEWPPRNSQIVDVNIDINNVSSRQSLDFCLTLDKIWSIESARKLNINVVALPYTRTDLIIFALNALLVDGPKALIHALDYITFNNVKVFSAFSYVEGEVVSAYVAAKRLWFYSDLCHYRIPAKSVFYSIVRGRPELEFSKEKALDKLLMLAREKTLFSTKDLYSRLNGRSLKVSILKQD